MFQKKLLAVALLGALAIPALAQTNSTSTGSGTGSASVGPITSSTANTFNTNVPGETIARQVVSGGTNSTVEQNGSSTVKTTGQAFLPGMSVSSGGFNCSGTSGLALGFTGGAISGGTTTEQPYCVALNAAVLYGQKGDLEMFESVMCELPAVKAARKKKGFDCDTLAPVVGYKPGAVYGTAVRMNDTELAAAGLAVPVAAGGAQRVTLAPAVASGVVVTADNTNDTFIKGRLSK